MSQTRALFIWLSASVALLFVSQFKINQKFQWRYPALNELVVTEYYMQDLSGLFFGSHRSAADLAYIQFLQYYGVREGEQPGEHREGETAEEHQAHAFEAGVYPRLKELATRYMRLDPFFNSAIIKAGGALAFNQNRIDEALDYLREAIGRDPSFFRYHLYVTAILYQHQGNDKGLINQLLEAIKYPDCPALLQGVLGNLLKKYGRFEEAAQVFWHTYQTVPGKADRELALHRLEVLIQEHPQLRLRIEQILQTKPH